MIKKNGGIFGRNPTYNDVVVEGILTLKSAQVFDNDITINGDLVVNGTTTSINTVNLDVDDKNISMAVVTAKVGLVATSNITAGQFTVQLASTVGLIPGMTVTKTAGTGAFDAAARIASVDSLTQITLDLAHTVSGSITFDVGGATDYTADGGGITVKGTTDKTIIWDRGFTAWKFSDRILTQAGTAAAPGLSFVGDEDTGIIRSAANAIGFVTNGVEKWLINTSGAFNPILNNTYDIGSAAVGVRTVHATTFDTNIAAAGVTLAGTTLSADGTDANISISITPKGTGVVLIPAQRLAGASDNSLTATNIVTFSRGSIVGVANPDGKEYGRISWLMGEASTGTLVENGYIRVIADGSQPGTNRNSAMVFGVGIASNSTVEAVRISKEGYWLINTTIARSPLTVKGDIALGDNMTAGGNATGYIIKGADVTSGNGNGGDLTIRAGNGSGAATNGNLYLQAGVTSSPGSVTTGGNVIITGGKPSGSQTAGYVSIQTYVGGTATDQVRVHPTGGVSVGSTTDPGAGNLSVNGKIYCDSGTTQWLTGQTLTLTRFTIAEPFIGLLSTSIGQFANDGTPGLYLITRIGTTSYITPIVNDAALTVAVNGSNQITVTNVSGGNRTIYASLLKLN